MGFGPVSAFPEVPEVLPSTEGKGKLDCKEIVCYLVYLEVYVLSSVINTSLIAIKYFHV